MLFSLALLGVLAQSPGLVPTTDTLPSASLFRPTPSHVILMSPVPAAAGGFSLDPAPSAQSRSPDDAAPQLVEYSDAYFTRLTIHRWASYLTVPLFASQYIVGQKLMNGDRSLRGVHGVLAASVAGLFAVNTITGGLNLIEGRKDPEGRTRRTLHSVLMLLADAGFVATGATAGESEDGYYRGPNNINRHRNIALLSMGTALVSYAIMLPIFGRD
jgi:hypothetical protein